METLINMSQFGIRDLVKLDIVIFLIFFLKSKSNTYLTHIACICVQVSQISSIFECLLEEEEKSLKENPTDSANWADVVLSVNTIIKVPLPKQLL